MLFLQPDDSVPTFLDTLHSQANVSRIVSLQLCGTVALPGGDTDNSTDSAGVADLPTDGTMVSLQLVLMNLPCWINYRYIFSRNQTIQYYSYNPVILCIQDFSAYYCSDSCLRYIVLSYFQGLSTCDNVNILNDLELFNNCLPSLCCLDARWRRLVPLHGCHTVHACL